VIPVNKGHVSPTAVPAGDAASTVEGPADPAAVWLTVTNRHSVEVPPSEDEVLILASVLALELAIDAEHHL
jgi:hypothetical protein